MTAMQEMERAPLTDKALIAATRPFAKEHRLTSWWHLLNGVTALIACLTASVMVDDHRIRVALAVLGGLLILRVFMIYHDFKHRAILRRSPVAKFIMHAFGMFVLTPPTVWRRSHDYHHSNTAKIVGSQLGSYPVLTDKMFDRLGAARRWVYRLARHPLTMIGAYFSLFLVGMCIAPLLKNPRKHWDAIAALAFHFSILGLVAYFRGVDVALLGVWLPHAIGCAAGAYLFYAQHNFPEAKLRNRHEWKYADAAMNASSFMLFARPWRWFFANIGHHHIHHLNPSVPFYRLPEAMAAVEELQREPDTSLSPRDIMACLKLKLWSHEQQQMLPFPSQDGPAGSPAAPAE